MSRASKLLRQLEDGTIAAMGTVPNPTMSRITNFVGHDVHRKGASLEDDPQYPPRYALHSKEDADELRRGWKIRRVRRLRRKVQT